MAEKKSVRLRSENRRLKSTFKFELISGESKVRSFFVEFLTFKNQEHLKHDDYAITTEFRSLNQSRSPLSIIFRPYIETLQSTPMETLVEFEYRITF